MMPPMLARMEEPWPEWVHALVDGAAGAATSLKAWAWTRTNDPETATFFTRTRVIAARRHRMDVTS